MNKDLRRRVILAAAIAVPIVSVKVAMIVLGSGPGSATAAPKEPALPEAIVAMPGAPAPLTADERGAIAYMASIASTPFADSPIMELTRAEIERGPDPVDIPIIQLRIEVRAIMRTADGDLALINGDLYRVGDRLLQDDFWALRVIDSDAGTVELHNNSTGQVRIVAVREDAPPS